MTLRLGGDGAITGCTSLEEPTISISGLTMTTPIVAIPGTAAAPSYTFSGDTDNGLYYAGTNSIGLSTAGTNAILINSSGKVGINQSSPTAFIHAKSGANDGTVIGTFEGATNNKLDIKFNATGPALNVTAGDPLVFEIGGSQKMQIDSSGRLLVGTTNAVAFGSRQVLAVANGTTGGVLSLYNSTTATANTRISSNPTGSEINDIGIHAASTNGSIIAYTNNDTERMRIDSSGRLIVGRTSSVTSGSAADSVVQIVGKKGSPTDLGQLTIARGNSASALGSGAEIGEIIFSDNAGANFAQIQCNTDGTSGSNDYPGRLTFHTTADGASSPSERLRIDSSGNVGIGTATPGSWDIESKNLVIASSVNTGITIAATGSNQRSNLYFSDGTSGSEKYIGGFTYNHADDSLLVRTAATERLRIDSSGRLLVGASSTSSVTRVVIQGNSSSNSQAIAYFQRGSANPTGADQLAEFKFADSNGSVGAEIAAFSDAAWASNDYPGRLVFSTTADGASSPTERLRIDSSGHILVGTTTAGFAAYGDSLTIANSSHCGMTLRGGTTSDTEIFFADGTTGTARYAGGIRYAHNTDHMQFTVSASERMRITSGGLVGIGTSTPSHPLDVRGGNTQINFAATESGGGYLMSTGAGQWGISGGVRFNGAGWYARHTQSSIIRDDGDANIRFFTNTGNTVNAYITPAERMRITSNSDGHVLVGKTAASASAGTGVQLLGGSAASVDVVINASSNIGVNHVYNINATNNGYRFYIGANGGIYNHSNNNSNLCDEREKKDIVVLDDKWDMVKSWKIKKFHYISDADSEGLSIGVIAQEVETQCPEVISDWVKEKAEDAVLDDEGNVVTPAKEEILRKGVKEQQMMWMGIKALQEAMAKIETLEQRLSDAGIA